MIKFKLIDMANCIIRHLKVNTENSGLPFFNIFSLYAGTATPKRVFVAVLKSPVNINLISDDVNASFSNEETIQEKTFEGCASVTSFDNLDNPVNVYASEDSEIKMKDCNRVERIWLLENSKLRSLKLEKLASALFNLEEFRLYYGTIIDPESNNIAYLGKLKKLNIVAINYSSTCFSGKIEEFVIEQCNSGRTQNLTGVTFDINSPLIFGTHSFASKITGVIKWENSSKMYVEDTGSSTLYCKGYSQEEAEAAFPDKTIIRVD